MHQNQRFSEDLDFDCNDVTLEEFNEMIAYIIWWLSYWWVEADWTVSKKEAMHGYIRCKHVLTQFWLAPDTREEVQEKLLIRIDAHDQWFTFEADKNILKWFWIQSVIPTAPLPLLMSHKIATIWQRKRAKWRDYFDLVFLMAKNVQPNMRYLEQKINISTSQGILSWLLDAYTDAWADYLAKDVQPFLFNPYDDSVKNFGMYVEAYERSSNEEWGISN